MPIVSVYAGAAAQFYVVDDIRVDIARVLAQAAGNNTEPLGSAAPAQLTPTTVGSENTYSSNTRALTKPVSGDRRVYCNI